MRFLKKLFKFLTITSVILLILGFSLYGYSRVSSKLEIKNANNISLYDKDGALFFVGNGTSKWIGLKDISKHLIDATISTEDKNF